MWRKRKPVNECPSHQQLEAFHLGQLSGSDFAAMTAHLDGCELCEDVLMQIARKQLGLPQQSEHLPSDQLLAEPELRELEAAASALTPRKPIFPSLLPAQIAPKVPGYEVIRLLAKNVFEARPQKSEEEVIVRLFRGSIIRDRAFLQRLVAHTREMSRLTQGCILAIRDVVQADAFTAVVMPLIEAESLAHIIRQRRTSNHGAPGLRSKLTTASEAEYIAAVTGILGQVLEVASLIHQRGGSYPELRSSSSLITPNLSLYLDDFAMSAFQGSKRGAVGPEPLTPSVSRYLNDVPDILVAHPAFVAPEEWRMERSIDAPRADVFRLGVLVYHALTLQLPYGAGSISGKTKPPLAPRLRQPLLSPELDAIVLRALATRREERFTSAYELHNAWIEHLPGG